MNTSEIVDTVTGEIVERLTEAEAERLTTRISLKLDAMADTYVGVMPLIREAIDREAYSALGYHSVSAYISDRFGGSLAKLGMDVRREVVRELSDAGMSTRAIAPVIGASHQTVANDLAAGVKDLTPVTPQTPAPESEGEAGEGAGQAPEGEVVATPRPPVTGLDGKTYNRPVPALPRAAARRPLPDFARDAGIDLRKAVERLQRIGDDDRFVTNKEQVASHLRSHLNQAVEVCQDLLNRIDNN